MGRYNILLVGGGGREHAMAWKLNQSKRLQSLYIAPGNPGTDRIGKNIDLDTDSPEEVTAFCKENQIDMVAIGPEKPLVSGLADELQRAGIDVFGPSKDASQLEGSKEFAKNFMKKYNIPTARYNAYSSGEFDKALETIRSEDTYPVVLKADGLAAGKGVFICESAEEAEKRLDQFRKDEKLRKASDKIVVEEFLKGEEASVFVLSDGHTAKILHNAQDHKRIGEGDTGLNTGGMGAYCPAPVLSQEMLDQVEKEIILPTITGMQLDGSPYKGILYLGLMITETGPKVVEYNCRFGDPECQAILPSLKNDLLELMIYANDQRLDEKEIQVDNLYRCCVVMASGGYPEAYEKGMPIQGLDDLDSDALLFHAGTAAKRGEIVTDGGRVLSVVGRGETLRDSIDHAYRNVRRLSFENAYFRNDIGAKGLRRSN